MALIDCPGCGRRVADTAPRCPDCLRAIALPPDETPPMTPEMFAAKYAAAPGPALGSCPACAGKVSQAAATCPHCGHPIKARGNPGIAFVLSAIVPGLGQMYRGQIAAGLGWLVGVPAAGLVGVAAMPGSLAAFVPGIVAYLGCLVHAAQGSSR